jgi:DNA-binding response OmpR family regulator
MGQAMALKEILVVEDDRRLGELVTEVLNDILGYRASAVSNGDDALAVVAGVHIDLVILDIDLPGPSGFAIHDLLRGSQHTATLPILFMTAGWHEPEFVQRGIASWLDKPFNLNDLVGRVDALLGPGAVVEGHSGLGSGHLETDEARHRH